MFSQCRHIANCWNQIGEFAQGTKGRVELRTDRFTIQVEGGDPLRFRGRRNAGNPFQVEHDVLFEAIRNDTPHNEAEYGALSTMTAILGRMATYSGKVVSWDDAFASNLQLTADGETWDSAAPIAPNEEAGYPAAVPGVTKAW
jgi:hypothetical protein